MSKGRDYNVCSSQNNKELGFIGEIVRNICVASVHNPTFDP